MARGYKYFEAIEKNAALLGILIVVMVSLGGLAEITPLFIQAHAVGPAPGLKPYDPLRLAGKDVYVREGCYLCHSQMIRALRAETQRYGPFLGRRRVRVRPAVPVGLQAHRSRSRAHRRQILRCVAAPASASLRARSSRLRTCRTIRGSRNGGARRRRHRGTNARAARARRSLHRQPTSRRRPKRSKTRPSWMRWWPICKDWALPRVQVPERVVGTYRSASSRWS